MEGNVNKTEREIKNRSHGYIITIIVFLMIYIVAIIICNEKVNVLREVLITTGLAAAITVIDRILQLKSEEFEAKKEQNLFLYNQIESIQNEELKVSLLKEIVKE